MMSKSARAAMRNVHGFIGQGAYREAQFELDKALAALDMADASGCSVCGGTRGWETDPQSYDPIDGHPNETEWITCPECGWRDVLAEVTAKAVEFAEHVCPGFIERHGEPDWLKRARDLLGRP